ncbi:hypothetical protein HUT18_06320 [Streptomyces sp. NA04227]|nr:hypothetical protein HUT18_06320 [Streptomyces sp. NA04227]
MRPARSSAASSTSHSSAYCSYAYDATGNTTSRPQGDKTQTLTWDPEGHLAKVTEPDGSGGQKTTEYLYDADGNRLIGRTPTETTLYLGHTEVVLPKGSTTPRATRYIDLGGGHQAVAKDDGTVSITLADHHGTAQLAVDAATQKLTQRRTLPFGGIRVTTPTNWPGTRGFVGGTNDGPSTGLTHLGAREYDSSLGQFVSVDPLLETGKPQTLNGYSYSHNNPLTYTDPGGLGNADCMSGVMQGCTNGVPDSDSTYHPERERMGCSWESCRNPVSTWQAEGSAGRDYDNDGRISFFPGLSVPDTGYDARKLINKFYSNLKGLSHYGFDHFADHGDAAYVDTDIRRELTTACDEVGCPWEKEFFKRFAGSSTVSGIGLGSFRSNGLSIKAGRPKKDDGDDLTEVGRWMDDDEFAKMKNSARVQEGAGGRTFVVRTGDPEDYKVTPAGTIFVRFKVPSSFLKPASKPEWAVIPGPNITTKMFGPPPLSMPPATCIVLVCRK